MAAGKGAAALFEVFLPGALVGVEIEADEDVRRDSKDEAGESAAEEIGDEDDVDRGQVEDFGDGGHGWDGLMTEEPVAEIIVPGDEEGVCPGVGDEGGEDGEEILAAKEPGERQGEGELTEDGNGADKQADGEAHGGAVLFVLLAVDFEFGIAEEAEEAHAGPEVFPPVMPVGFTAAQVQAAGGALAFGDEVHRFVSPALQPFYPLDDGEGLEEADDAV